MVLNTMGSAPFGGNTSSSSNVIQMGPELLEISTEALGFQSIAGDAKLRLLPSSWPSDNLPPPTSCLLAIASRKGLLAAAGPTSVIVASTSSVRQAFSVQGSADGNIKSFSPQLTLDIGVRISQVAFTFDEELLILSAENGGGLAVYEVQSLMNGGTQSAFELPTGGKALRALAPNPAPETAEFICLVSTDGELMMANLKARQILAGPQGSILRKGISCVSWSKKGKQLVAGQGDGTCVQMTPEGHGKADIPKPDGLEGDQHISSILWLENNHFFIAYTPSSHEPGMPPITTYALVERKVVPSIHYLFRNVPDPCPPFGLDRSAPYQFLCRLKDFPPNLSEALVVASTVSIDIGLVTKSKTPLTSDAPSEQVADVFTTTTMAEDSRRAQLPMAEDMMDASPDTSAIGVALDLSSTEKVSRPLPKEEYDESPGPLPAVMVLNNEGVLAAWWIVYADSVRQGKTYPGLAVEAGKQTQQQPSQPSQNPSPFASASTSQTGFASGQAKFGQTAAPPSNTSSQPAAPTFSSPSTPATFGASSGLGRQTSPWGGQAATSSTTQGSTPAFGKPAFGSASPMGVQNQGSAFGVAGGLGNRSSPWANPSAGTAVTSASAFSSTTGAAPNQQGGSSGGFASFASKPSAFSSMGTASNKLFGPGSSASPLGPSQTTTSAFGQPSSFQTTSGPSSGGGFSSAFKEPAKLDPAQNSTFGGGFTLGSTFKSDVTAASDGPKPSGDTGPSMFGSSFGQSLGQAQTETPQPKDADMEDDTEEVKNDGPAQVDSEVKPIPKEEKKAATEVQTMPPKSSGLFGTQAQSATAPAKVQSSAPALTPPSTSFAVSTTPQESPENTKDLPPVETSPKIKAEVASSNDELSSPAGEEEEETSQESESPTDHAPRSSEAPLPPESTSKISYGPGDSSNSSKSSGNSQAEPSLPPDPSVSKSKLNDVQEAPAEQPKLTEESDEGIDDEGSGVDVAQEMSSPSDQTQSPKISPESSFGGPKTSGSGLQLFPKSSPVQTAGRDRALFGEVGGQSVPFLPPNQKTQQSPRSPSPVRPTSHAVRDTLRPDSSRSFSAPSQGQFNAAASRRLATKQIVTSPQEPRIPVAELRRQEEERLSAERNKKLEEEHQDLEDDEDEYIQSILADPIPASRYLDPFLAHQDYTGYVDKPGIPGQIEKVYRDINSMIDTLGLNARNVASFIKGHSDVLADSERDVISLDHPDDWNLEEVPELRSLELQLAAKLEAQKFPALQDIRTSSLELKSQLNSLHQKRADFTKAIEKMRDPRTNESILFAPLTLEQSSLRDDLYKKMLGYQKNLATAEEEVSLLRARLASCNVKTHSRNGHPNGSTKSQSQPQRPTVEAVTKTIMKMTRMIEERNQKIDMFESQLASLSSPRRGGGSANGSSRPGSRASREATPLAASMNSLSLSQSQRKSPSSSSLSPNGKSSRLSKSLQGSSPLKSPKYKHTAAILHRSSQLRKSLVSDSPTSSSNTFTVPSTLTDDEEEEEESGPEDTLGAEKVGQVVIDSENEDEQEEDEDEDEEEEERIKTLKEKMRRRNEVNGTMRRVFEKAGPRIRALE